MFSSLLEQHCSNRDDPRTQTVNKTKMEGMLRGRGGSGGVMKGTDLSAITQLMFTGVSVINYTGALSVIHER